VRSVDSMALSRRTPSRRIVESWWRIAGLALLVLVALPALASAAPAWRVVAQTNTTVAPGDTTNFRVEVRNVGDTPAGGSPMAFAGSVSSGLRVTAIAALSPRPSAWSCFTGSLPARTVSCSNNSDTVSPSERVLFQVTAQALGSEGAVETGTFTMAGGGAPSSSGVATTTVSSTLPGFGIDILDGATTADASGPISTQAGGHPYATTVSLALNTVHNPAPLIGDLWPIEALRDVVTDLPPGLVGNPSGLAQCTAAELANGVGTGPQPLCASSSQVGVATIRLNGNGGIFDAIGPLPVFNLVPPPGVPARFGFNALGVLVTLDARVRSGSDYGLSIVASNTPEALPIAGTTVTFWGVPADASHDAERACPGEFAPWGAGPHCTSSAPRAAFLRNSTSCAPSPGSPVDDGLVTTMHVDSWAHPGRVGADGLPDLTDPAWKSASYVTHQPPGFPFPEGAWGAHVLPTGCDAVPFDPVLAGLPDAGAKPGAPAGFNFDVTLPQTDDPLTVGTSDLRKAVVTLPLGVRVSPSAVNGRQACSSAQIAVDSSVEPTCPDASRIGSVRIDTPLLPDPLEGAVYLAAQNDNPFNSLLAVYFVVHGPGVIVKLAGHVEADPVTGQLTTTFDDNPQLPFSRLHLAFDGGPHAPLVLPQQCGSYTTTATLVGWNGDSVPRASTFGVSGDAAECSGGTTFSPGFAAGTESPIAGSSSTFQLRLTRADRDQELKALTVEMPSGLTGRIASVELCGAAQASSGACPDGSRVGSVTVGAGAGPDPFYVTGGRAYLTGPYKGAPYGLAIVVPAKAGPFDLGTVVVRSALFVDKHTADVSVVSDPLPTILQGIPLDVRDVRVSIDKDGFFLNPTSCAEKTIRGAIESTAGATAQVSSRFQAAECANLDFEPRLVLAVGGRGHTARNRTTPLTATLTMPRGANLRFVRVVLPKAINARLTVIQDACTRAEFEADISKCDHARAGTAEAVTPLLRDPLTGSAYFVKNGHGIPDLFVALRGPIDFDLIGKVTIVRNTFLTNTFDSVPDVPVTSFTLKLFGDRKNGSVGAAANLCAANSRRQKAELDFKAQNGRTIERHQRLVIHGCSKQATGKREGHARGR
jgi:hypothetical protein